MNDVVNHPAHYQMFGVEVADIIRLVLNSPENQDLTMYEAYCMGNELKYRLRAGFKGDPAQDMAKAMQYHRMREPSPLNDDAAAEIDEYIMEKMV